MIRVVRCDGSGSVASGGEELLDAPAPPGGAVWIDLEGRDPRYESLLSDWGFHPLAIEDAFTLNHQPKIEQYDDTIFLIARGIDFNVARDNPSDGLRTLKLAAFVSAGRLVTFHRAPLRSVGLVRRRLEESGRAFPGGAMQILWNLCDEMLDLYFPIVETIGEEIESLEQGVVEAPTQAQLERVLQLRRGLSTLRRNVLPHRGVFQHLANARGALVDDTAALSFRDTLDNVLRLGDAIEQQRDLLTNVKDTYLSVVAQRTNDVMRVLTVFSAIVLPLSLVAGIYGMNFENIPELRQPWGYFFVLGGMASIAAGLLLWFRRKGWI